MANLDEKQIKYIKRGELYSLLCLAVALTGVILFAVCYPIARARGLHTLFILSCVLPPVLIAFGSLGSALFNLKFGAQADSVIRSYILNTCLENAKAMHPERDSLTFHIKIYGCKAEMSANSYKESILFDFSAFNKLSPVRRASIATEIGNRLTVSFCRLYERGTHYKDVNYIIENGDKKSKPVPIIADGVPDKKSFKLYLKNKE